MATDWSWLPVIPVAAIVNEVTGGFPVTAAASMSSPIWVGLSPAVRVTFEIESTVAMFAATADN